MRRIGLSLYSTIAALVIASPAIAKAPTAVSEAAASSPAASQAAAVVDAFHQALQRGNTETAAALLADDVLIYESGSVEQSKAVYAAHHLSADAAFSKATNRVIMRRSSQAINNLAWIATASSITGIYKGRPINSIATETMVLRLDGVAWRIIHIHWSSATVK
jgi:ketosteroid isomerase-like protein